MSDPQNDFKILYVPRIHVVDIDFLTVLCAKCILLHQFSELGYFNLFYTVAQMHVFNKKSQIPFCVASVQL